MKIIRLMLYLNVFIIYVFFSWGWLEGIIIKLFWLLNYIVLLGLIFYLFINNFRY